MRPRTDDTRWLAGSVCAVALLTGWLLAALLPLGQAADEGAHAARVEALSEGTLFGHREGAGGGFTTDSALLDVAGATAIDRAQTRTERDGAETVGWDALPRFIDVGTIATYFPAVYAPAAAAVAAARALDLRPASAFRLARDVNVLVYALLGAAALLFARRAHALFAAALLLPMSLGLAASLSGDGALLGLATVAAAALTRGTARSWWVAAGVTTVIALTKPPYAALALALLAGPVAPPLSRRVRAGVLAAAVLAAGGWAAANQAYVLGTIGRAPYEAGPLWPGPPRTFTTIDPAAQLRVLAADPSRAITVPARTLARDVWTRRQMIGVLGWLRILLPDWLYAGWTVVLAVCAAALFAERRRGAGFSWGALGVAGGAWAVLLAQYLGWTPVGAETIEGIQGRYYLPLLPFAATAVPGLRSGPGGDALARLALLPLAAGALGAVVVPLAVATASYLR